MSPEEDRTRDIVDREPKHYQLSYSGPQSSHLKTGTPVAILVKSFENWYSGSYPSQVIWKWLENWYSSWKHTQMVLQ